MDDPKWKYASVKEVSVRAAVSVATVRRWCEDGLVLARRTPGDTWRVFVDDDGWPLEPEPEDDE